MSLAGHSISHCFTVTCHSLSCIAKWYRINCYAIILFTVQVGFYFMRCIDLLCAENAGAVCDCAGRSLEGTLTISSLTIWELTHKGKVSQHEEMGYLLGCIFWLYLSKYHSIMTDGNLESCLRLDTSSNSPEYTTLDDSIQCKSSKYRKINICFASFNVGISF